MIFRIINKWVLHQLKKLRYLNLMFLTEKLLKFTYISAEAEGSEEYLPNFSDFCQRMRRCAECKHC